MRNGNTTDNKIAKTEVVAKTRSVSKADRKSQLLHAVNGAAEYLLSAELKIQDSLRKGIELMAACIDIDRVNIWRYEKIHGVSRHTLEFEWLRGNGQNVPAGMEIGSYFDLLPEWENTLNKGGCVNGPVSGFSEKEQKMLGPYGIKSVLVLPVHLQSSFWGFVSFDDCREERFFADDEVSILKSGSLLLASAINRNEAAAKKNEADERTQLMLDSVPLCCNLWNKEFKNIDCNLEAVKLFELKNKQEYLDRFFELSPEYQPNGRLSSQMVLENIRTAFRDGRKVFEWMHRKLDGTAVPSEITLVRVKHEDDYIVTGYTRDLREHKAMMAEIEIKDSMLQTVNKIAAILLQSEINEFESDLWRCMGMVAETEEVDRVYIWKNHVKNGELYSTQVYEWSEAAEPQQDGAYAVDIPFRENGPGWEEKLSNNNVINGIVREMSPEEQAQLSPQGIMSILVVPVFLKEHFWGFVGIDDCSKERKFSDSAVMCLRSVSLLFANAMLRNEMTKNIHSTASKMEAVISNYNGVIWSVDSNSNITLFSGLYLKELGVTPSFLEGKNLEVARRRNRHLDIIDNVEKTIKSGPQSWISDIDGKMFKSHTTPIYGVDGNVTGVVGSIDDITDTMRLQKELEAAVEEAQAASRAKSNFLSNMSHEMRTPMNAIIGMTSIGRSTTDPAKKDYAFGKIDDASNHLLGVINDVLDMSKIEANKFELSEVEFNFETMLQKVVNIISSRIEEKQQHFSVYLDSNVPQNLIGDDQRLTQVIINLLTNAVKFTPEKGSIKLSTKFIKEEDGCAFVQVEVSDTGIGISDEQKSRLFRSFEQAESSTSRKFGGTGLGLVISKHIIELMDGSIWVNSEMGKGSVFAFNVRLGLGSAKKHALTKFGVSRENVNIMVVDDEPETLEYFANILDKYSFSYAAVSCGEEALALIESKGSFDIYFVDWNMPGMNGIELSRKIKEKNDEKSVIIMISSAEWYMIKKEAKAAGVDFFLAKPLFPSSVLNCINKSLGVDKTDAAKVKGDSVCFKGYRLLLAEDLEINREIVLTLLEPTQLEIDCAENGIEAVKMFSEDPDKYDMIFMDIQMPEMDGYEATRRIRAMNNSKAKSIPIVAMTANVFKEDIEKCLESGMNDHAGKPLDFNEVLEKLKHYLR